MMVFESSSSARRISNSQKLAGRPAGVPVVFSRPFPIYPLENLQEAAVTRSLLGTGHYRMRFFKSGMRDRCCWSGRSRAEGGIMRRLVPILCVGLTCGLAAILYASIPDANGVIHSCVAIDG